jgi:putative DNA primase/helicase
MTAMVSRAMLEDQGRRIVEGLGGKWSNGSGMCCCPAHDDSTPSLSVRVGDTSLLFKCFSGCETLAVIRALRSGGQVGRAGVRSTDDSGLRKPVTDAGMAKRLWDATVPIAGTIAETYLERRHITARSEDIRFHPRAQLGSKPNVSFHPALIAAIRDNRGLVAVHRTFLDAKSGWKAAIPDPKRMLGRPGTGAVRLAPAGPVLGLAEGLETALSAMDILGFPVWAVLGNERFGIVSIPAVVQRLIILPDPDKGGERASALAENQAREGLSIETLLPPGKGRDWNDVAMSRGGEMAGAV